MSTPCISKSDSDAYEKARRISNARFDYKPRYICYCNDAEDVSAAFNRAKNEGLAVRVRSGGHHHEGMCSGDDVLIIDVSPMSYVNFENNDNVARIGAGTRLCDVYTKLIARKRILPGGGCGDVRVGGLVQGGGWGPYSRKLGLTCDQLKGVMMVPTNGGKPFPVTDASNKDLMWAIRGAGGGNFGVITEYIFDLYTLTGPITEFTIKLYNPDDALKAVTEWRDNFYKADNNLTSFCRITAPGSGDPFLVIAGSYLGDENTLRNLLPTLLTYNEMNASFNTARPDCAPHPEYQPGPHLLGAAPGDLSTTCDGSYYPHKVSSTFPFEVFPDAAVSLALEYVRKSKPIAGARRYLSLHGMGGAITTPRNSCFYYRNKPFMLQYQAWWQDLKNRKRTIDCMSWVRQFRHKMSGYTQGAFINFPDVELADDRKELLAFYYGDKLSKLITIKGQNDPENVLDFPMGIPVK